MPVNIPDKLPSNDILRQENVFVMNESQAIHQDIRPLKIAILNLMPVKMTTETHLLRMLSNSPLQVEITLLYTATHIPKNTPMEHLNMFYKNFNDVKDQKFDGMIITGAPIEHLEFEEVYYWKELSEIMKWSDTNVTSTLFICWGAQAGLKYFYNIPKYDLPKKVFGVFEHKVHDKNIPLVRGFDDVFLAPHSRNTENKAEDILKVKDLELVSTSNEAGVYIAQSKDGRKVFVTGHSEYELLTLKDEYLRDREKGIDIDLPKHYFPNNDPANIPQNRWKSHGSLLYANWLNYYVYQLTPFDI
jgi:homoserine O-succinyltransferase